MGYGSRNAWPPQKKAPFWGSGWQASKNAAKEHPWKCVGTGGCGYSWNKPQHRFCNQCNLHWDFGQRMGGGKDAPGTPAAVPGSPGTAPILAAGAPDPAIAATRTADIAKLRAELVSIKPVLADDHVEVTTRQGKLAALEAEQRASLPEVPGNTQLTRVLAKIRSNKVFHTKNAKTLVHTEARMAAAKKAHDEAVAWQKQIDSELLELENEQSKLCATLSTAAGESDRPAEEFEIDSNAGWEDMFEEIFDDENQSFSSDVQDQYEKFRKTRSALQRICRQVKQSRVDMADLGPGPGAAEQSPERKPDSEMEDSGEPTPVTTVKRPSQADVGTDASRRRVT
jgi:hypothetical protein